MMGPVAPARIGGDGGGGQVSLVEGVLWVVEMVVGTVGVERGVLFSLVNYGAPGRRSSSK